MSHFIRFLAQPPPFALGEWHTFSWLTSDSNTFSHQFHPHITGWVRFSRRFAGFTVPLLHFILLTRDIEPYTVLHDREGVAHKRLTYGTHDVQKEERTWKYSHTDTLWTTYRHQCMRRGRFFVGWGTPVCKEESHIYEVMWAHFKADKADKPMTF